MPKYSIVVPVYNRPDEVEELLNSLVRQDFTDFEVVIVEDGSTLTSRDVVKGFSNLDIHYYEQENSGQGFARNYGFEKSTGELIIVLDSDCILPESYLTEIEKFLKDKTCDAFGGPDKAHDSFTPLQKAISHSMTSFITTGGIRGREKHVGSYHPRSFNMGFYRHVYESIGGYKIPFMGEDLEFSTRILKSGFKSALIPSAFVYHKRRTSLWKFYKQLEYFGRARINLSRFHAGQVGLVHLFPLVFSIGIYLALALFSAEHFLGVIGVSLYIVFFLAVAVEALIKSRSIVVSVLAPITTLIQMVAYGNGLVREFGLKLFGVNPNKKYIDLY